MHPNDVPESITSLYENGPWIVPDTPKRVAAILAHFWPAIEQHVREQVAAEIEQTPLTVDGGPYPMQTAVAVDAALSHCARIARGINPNT